MPTEKQLLAREEQDYMYCTCHNVIPIASIHCPFCRIFNRATTANECPTCGQAISQEPKPVEEPEVVL